jgi:hypothetical protein
MIYIIVCRSFAYNNLLVERRDLYLKTIDDKLNKVIEL